LQVQNQPDAAVLRKLFKSSADFAGYAAIGRNTRRKLSQDVFDNGWFIDNQDVPFTNLYHGPFTFIAT
jgi:hypothetical protein